MTNSNDTPTPSPHKRRVGRWILVTLGVLFLLLVVDYFAYPRFAQMGGNRLNRGENGVWLRYTWYFGTWQEAAMQEKAPGRRIRELAVHSPPDDW
ncbi:MAG: hypothetical protein ACYDBB_25005 [Armatimonadota bacterium]